MSGTGYAWRRLSAREREGLLAWRRENGRPWHSPPHRPNADGRQFHLTASCYEHLPHIGHSRERMDAFARDLLATLNECGGRVLAWCLLPNHYHALVETPDVLSLLRRVGRLHGRTSHAWNGEEGTRGRCVFYRAVEREIRSEGHAFATMNYVHHNPVHHGYATRWTDWPWSSAAEFLEQEGEVEARRIWTMYPVGEYGRGWDDAAM